MKKIANIFLFFFCNTILWAQCPDGYVVGGADVSVNGDFDSGNADFSSAYIYVANGAGQTELNPEGYYSVHTNPNDLHSAFSACSDAVGTGNFMIINGSPTADEVVWEQSVTVLTGTLYYFVCELSSVHPDNPAELQFSVNGSLLGSVITASSTTCQWDQFYATWNSGVNTTATISIVNKNTIASGNDFAIDKISFVPCDVILPIELVSFKPKQIHADTVKIEWVTSTENNNDFFTLEKSLDGISYTILDTIYSKFNNSNFDITYSYFDSNITTGLTYYRLKQTDFDGKFEYSDVAYVNAISTKSMHVVYNSTNHDCRIVLQSKEQVPVGCKIESVSGVEVYNSDIFTSKILNLDLPSGTYICTVFLENGNNEQCIFLVH